jgi:asparagine synthase (glutamine-hydrolysing)
MTQSTNKNSNRSDHSRVRHGVVGLHSSAENLSSSTSLFETTSDAKRTGNWVTSTDGLSYTLATTGTTSDLSGGGSVIISGQPHFRDEKLAAVASVSGAAAAVALGYKEHSHNIFSYIFGSFCCAIVDTKSDRVLIGIDRLGQQSLYYSVTDGTLAFGSSASSVPASKPNELQLLNQGMYNYLYFHMVPCPGTAYRGLKKVPAGHYIEYQDGQLRLATYWKPVFSESTTNQSIESLSKKLMDTLRSSVENCLPAAGKVGSFLSGGLDSSTVTGLLAEVGGGKAEAYSIGFSAKGYDEMAFARITARHFGVQLNEYYVTPQDVVDALPIIATNYDEPFGNSSALPAYFCAKMAVENGAATLLAGDGGDEIFAGNERYIKQRAFEYYGRVPHALRSTLIEPLVNGLSNTLPLASKAKSYISQANMPMPDRLQSYNFLHRHAASDIFTDAFLTEVDAEEPIELLRSIYHRPDQASDLNRMLYLDWQITLADNDLRKVSHMCAFAGVDVAYPMLDDALVELSCQIPSAWKIKGADLRHFFKHALKDWLPQETIHKSKQGFGLPFGVWMQTYKPLREMAYDNLLKLKHRNFIRPEFIDKTIKMHQSDHAAYYGELVWIFTVFELWMEGHSRSQPIEARP